jgi:hypothetical protein
MSKSSLVLHLGTVGGIRTFHEMHEGEQRVVKLVHELRDASVIIGGESPAGAVVFERGSSHRVGVAGNVDEHVVITALNDARLAGITSDITVAVSVENNRSSAALPDSVVEALSEFGSVTVLLVGDDRSVAIATVGNNAVAA